jgi:prevent-host-death family protein
MAKLTVNVHEAKTNLSRLIERALAGETVVIARAGEPAVTLTPVAANDHGKERPLGLLKGKIRIAPDFDDDDPVIRAMFEGRADKTSGA